VDGQSSIMYALIEHDLLIKILRFEFPSQFFGYPPVKIAHNLTNFARFHLARFTPGAKLLADSPTWTHPLIDHVRLVNKKTDNP
ncbi:MAG TPA: hypothetical protein P5121_30800, partial [Caldilineaceae bacterium]|nr:hypothetical protein [Caldilineaceae bacterium]